MPRRLTASRTLASSRAEIATARRLHAAPAEASPPGPARTSPAARGPTHQAVGRLARASPGAAPRHCRRPQRSKPEARSTRRQRHAQAVVVLDEGHHAVAGGTLAGWCCPLHGSSLPYCAGPAVGERIAPAGRSGCTLVQRRRGVGRRRSVAAQRQAARRCRPSSAARGRAELGHHLCPLRLDGALGDAQRRRRSACSAARRPPDRNTSRSRAVSWAKRARRSVSAPWLRAPRGVGAAARDSMAASSSLRSTGLVKKVHRAGLHRADAGGEVAMAGEEDHRQPHRRAGASDVLQVQPRRTGHAQVEQQAARACRAADRAGTRLPRRSRAPQSRPAPSRRCSALRTDSSSSTIWITGGCVMGVWFARQAGCSPAASELGRNRRGMPRRDCVAPATRIRTAMGLDDAARDGQAQTHAAALGAVEGIKDPGQVGDRDAGAGVDHAELHARGRVGGFQAHLAPVRGQRVARHRKAFRHRLMITCWICTRVAHHVGPARGQRVLQRDSAPPGLGTQQRGGIADNFVEAPPARRSPSCPASSVRRRLMTSLARRSSRRMSPQDLQAVRRVGLAGRLEHQLRGLGVAEDRAPAAG